MASDATIVLIGPRAAGKTSVGRALGRQLGRPFTDLDDLVRARFGGASVAEIWARHGEEAFRATEAQVLDEALARPHAIVALGGGTPMIARANRALSQARASGRIRIVLLLADTGVLADRISTDATGRPSLTGKPPAAEVDEVLAERLPTYRALADATFDTGVEPPEDIARAVDRWARR